MTLIAPTSHAARALVSAGFTLAGEPPSLGSTNPAAWKQRANGTVIAVLDDNSDIPRDGYEYICVWEYLPDDPKNVDLTSGDVPVENLVVGKNAFLYVFNTLEEAMEYFRE